MSGRKYYDVAVEQIVTMTMTMADGVALMADIYRPVGEEVIALGLRQILLGGVLPDAAQTIRAPRLHRGQPRHPRASLRPTIMMPPTVSRPSPNARGFPARWARWGCRAFPIRA